MSNHPINNINSAFFRSLPINFPFKSIKPSSGLTVNFSTNEDDVSDSIVILTATIDNLDKISVTFEMDEFIQNVSNFVSRYKDSNKKVTSEDLLKEDLLPASILLQKEIYKKHQLYHYNFMELPIYRSMTIAYNYKLSQVTRAYVNTKIYGDTLNNLKSDSLIDGFNGPLGDVVYISLFISPVIEGVILSITEDSFGDSDSYESESNYIKLSNLNSSDLRSVLKLNINNPIFLDNIAYAAKEYASYIKDSNFDLEKYLSDQGDQNLSLEDDYDFLDL